MTELQNAFNQLSDRFNIKLRSGLSGREFCDIHERWAKSPANRVTLSNGSVVRMSENFAYLFLVEETNGSQN